MRPPRVTGCSWPWTRVIPSARPERSAVAKLPSGATTLGRTSSSWRKRYGSQAAISAGSGSRLPGGLHLSTVARYASSSARPGSEQPLEKLPRATGERLPVPVLVEPRRLAHEDELGVRVPLAEDDLRAALGERAADAARSLGGRFAQR